MDTNGLKAILIVGMFLAWMLQMEHKKLVDEQIDAAIGAHHVSHTK